MAVASQPLLSEQTQLAQQIARERFSIDLTGLSDVAPYYAVAAQFDPLVLGAGQDPIRLHLDLAAGAGSAIPAGIASLAHQLPDDAELLRHSSGFSEITELAKFFSPEQVIVRGKAPSLTLRHGGNLFLKHRGAELWNRLWAYNEISDSFWWSVSVCSGSSGSEVA